MTGTPVTSPPIAPAPGALPLLGHVLPFLRDPLAFLSTARDPGGLLMLRLGPVRAFLVCTPELAQRVLRDTATFDKGGAVFDAFRETFGMGVVGCPHTTHARQRRAVEPAFDPSRMPGYADTISDEVGVLVAGWRPGQVIDLNAALHRLVTSITLRMLFPTGVTDQTVTDVHDSLHTIMAGVYWRVTIPVAAVHALPIPANRRFQRAKARLHAVLDELVTANPQTDGGAALPLFRTAGLTGQALHDEVTSVLVAALEPTTAALAWAFSVLGRNPDAERRLHEEVDEILAGRPAGLDDLPHLPYTRRAVTEVMRLYPPMWMLTRATTRDTELDGHRIPAGSVVMMSPYALQRDPTVYDEPDEFRPDRWLPGSAVPPDAWLPFGEGDRKCLGYSLGFTEVMLTVATIASHWRPRPTRPGPARLVPRGDLNPGPLPMFLERRH
jgi:cytochrome P450